MLSLRLSTLRGVGNHLIDLCSCGVIAVADIRFIPIPTSSLHENGARACAGRIPVACPRTLGFDQRAFGFDVRGVHTLEQMERCFRAKLRSGA